MARNQPVLVRLAPPLRRRLGVLRRQLNVTPPEAIRHVLDQHLPADPGATDPNQLRLVGDPEAARTYYPKGGYK